MSYPQLRLWLSDCSLQIRNNPSLTSTGADQLSWAHFDVVGRLGVWLGLAVVVSAAADGTAWRSLAGASILEIFRVYE